MYGSEIESSRRLSQKISKWFVIAMRVSESVLKCEQSIAISKYLGTAPTGCSPELGFG